MRLGSEYLKKCQPADDKITSLLHLPSPTRNHQSYLIPTTSHCGIQYDFRIEYVCLDCTTLTALSPNVQPQDAIFSPQPGHVPDAFLHSSLASCTANPHQQTNTPHSSMYRLINNTLRTITPPACLPPPQSPCAASRYAPFQTLSHANTRLTPSRPLQLLLALSTLALSAHLIATQSHAPSPSATSYLVFTGLYTLLVASLGLATPFVRSPPSSLISVVLEALVVLFTFAGGVVRGHPLYLASAGRGVHRTVRRRMDN